MREDQTKYLNYTLREYRNKEYSTFIRDYEIFVVSFLRRRSFGTTAPIDFKKIEKTLIVEINNYLIKRINILTEYFLHCEIIGKEISEKWGDQSLTQEYYKLIFLARKARQIDSTLQLDQHYSSYKENNKEIIEKIENINDALGEIDNEKSLNAVQKIIYLNELGIIDFLKGKQPFNTSTNGLATILGKILHEKTTTLQPYLNALFTDLEATSNKHPYYTKSTAEKIKDSLQSIGFKK